MTGFRLPIPSALRRRRGRAKSTDHLAQRAKSNPHTPINEATLSLQQTVKTKNSGGGGGTNAKIDTAALLGANNPLSPQWVAQQQQHQLDNMNQALQQQFAFTNSTTTAAATGPSTPTSTSVRASTQPYTPMQLHPAYSTNNFNNFQDAKQPEQTVERSTAVVAGKSSLLSRSRYFQDLCDWAFEVVDTDRSGSVDEKELYSGLLLIHLKLGSYAGPAACRPLDRDQCRSIFVLMDTDKSGTLDKHEFKEVMMVLFSNVLLRVATLWSMTIMIVPLVSKQILDGITWILTCLGHTITFTFDKYDIWSATNEFDFVLDQIMDSIIYLCPQSLLKMAHQTGHYVSYVPQGVWNTIPLTFISTILGTLVVPWLLLKIDEFFQSLANKRSGKNSTGEEV